MVRGRIVDKRVAVGSEKPANDEQRRHETGSRARDRQTGRLRATSQQVEANLDDPGQSDDHPGGVAGPPLATRLAEGLGEVHHVPVRQTRAASPVRLEPAVGSFPTATAHGFNR